MSEKRTFGLLNGLAKRDYFGELGITSEFLQEQLYPDTSPEDFGIIMQKFESILKNIAYSNMDLKQLDAYLTSQSKKKANYLTEEEILNVTKFWKQNKQKVYDVIVERSRFSDKMKTFQWRIDVGYHGSNQTDNPKAIFSIDTDSEELKKQMIHFEADSGKLDEMVSQIEKIEEKIANFVSN
jgi:HCaRG protein.